MDGHSRKIVGWSVSDTLNRSIALDALDMAVQREKPSPGLIHHSDRGCQYASDDYQDALDQAGIEPSMSAKGCCWDNAPMESFFDSLKCEHVFDDDFIDVVDARRSIFEWIEVFYNRIRLHSSLGYQTPACVHDQAVAESA